MIHYMNRTCESMSNGPDLNVWRVSIPEEAVRYEFLMDGILALSSLHLALESPGLSRRYHELALHYQNVGLRRYTDALKDITADNSHALFAYAVMITVMAIANPGFQKQTGDPNYKKSLVNMFELLQGVRIISAAYGESLRSGKFGSLFRDTPLGSERSLTDPDVLKAMNSLRERANTVAKYVRPEIQGTYLSGIENLEIVFEVMAASSHLGPIVSWPAMIDGHLVELFKQGDPMAELIFLHYGLLLLYTHDRWWGKQFGRGLIGELITSISSISLEWASCTTWVREYTIIAT